MRYRVRKHPAFKRRIGAYADDAKVHRDLVRKIGFAVEARAKRKAPVDHGRLRGSISTSWRGHRGKATSFKDYVANQADACPSPTRNVVWVGSSVEYALPVHERHPRQSKFLERALTEVRGKLASIAKSFNR